MLRMSFLTSRKSNVLSKVKQEYFKFKISKLPKSKILDDWAYDKRD